MKRLLACLLVLILLCGQSVLAEDAARYTLGWACDIEDFSIIVNGENIPVPPAYFRFVSTNQYDQAQLLFQFGKDGEEIWSFQAEELPDGSGSITLSNCRDKVSFRGDELPLHVFIANVLHNYNPDFAKTIPTLPEILKSLEKAWNSEPAGGQTQYGQYTSTIEKLDTGSYKYSVSTPTFSIEFLGHLYTFDADSPLFDLSDKNPVPYSADFNIPDNPAIAQAIMEVYSNLLQDEGIQRLTVLFSQQFAKELPDQK